MVKKSIKWAKANIPIVWMKIYDFHVISIENLIYYIRLKINDFDSDSTFKTNRLHCF